MRDLLVPGMLPVEQHDLEPDASFDGGELDCGNGLLLLIRQHLDALEPGQVLEIRSREPSVEEDLPAWCRLTNNELLSWIKSGKQRSFLVRKSGARGSASTSSRPPASAATVAVEAGQSKSANLLIPPLAVMGIGSWPRPKWMLRAVHEYLEGKISDEDFQEIANDAVRLAVSEQEKSGVDVITDGEQRRDNYASFVGKRLENCQLIPLVDLLPLVDHPEEFEQQLKQLDVPAAAVRHPAVFGKIKRRSTLAAHECKFLRTITDKPIKVSLPGPYLLTRTMYLDCFKERAYATRDELANDIVGILREEIADLLVAGAALIQLDEPILTEIVFGSSHGQRSFMCGALSERGAPDDELQFAINLINAVIAAFPRDRLAMHVCRGNWTPDESAALTGSSSIRSTSEHFSWNFARHVQVS